MAAFPILNPHHNLMAFSRGNTNGRGEFFRAPRGKVSVFAEKPVIYSSPSFASAASPMPSLMTQAKMSKVYATVGDMLFPKKTRPIQIIVKKCEEYQEEKSRFAKFFSLIRQLRI